MISETIKWKHYCSGDYSKVENYEKAVADKEHTWDIHHRDEIRVLPSGTVSHRSVQDLIDEGLYYNVPPESLIFLTHEEHMRIHRIGNNGLIGHRHSEETRRKMSEKTIGHQVSEETREKLRKYHTGLKASNETREKMSKSHKGKKLGPCPEERKRKIRISILRFNAKRGEGKCL